MRFLEPKIKKNYLFLEKLIKTNGYCLQYIPDEFKDDFNLSILAVKQNGLSISFVEGDLRKNKKIIIEAIKSYDFIDSSMKLDKDVNAAFMKYSMI